MPKVFQMKWRWSLFVIASLVFIAGCGVRESNEAASGDTNTEQLTTDGKSLTPVTLQLNWFPEAEHGGYYAALVHGFFADEGLDVEIIPGASLATPYTIADLDVPCKCTEFTAPAVKTTPLAMFSAFTVAGAYRVQTNIKTA